MRRPLKRYREWNTFHKLTVVSLHAHRHGSAAQRHGIDAFHNNVRGHFVFRFLPYLFRTRNDIRVLLPDALPLLRPLSADAEMILDNHRHGRMIPRASFRYCSRIQAMRRAFWSSFSNRTGPTV